MFNFLLFGPIIQFFLNKFYFSFKMFIFKFIGTAVHVRHNSRSPHALPFPTTPLSPVHCLSHISHEKQGKFDEVEIWLNVSKILWPPQCVCVCVCVCSVTCVCVCVNNGTCTHNRPSVLLVSSLASGV
jgi:hypothetical protein